MIALESEEHKFGVVVGDSGGHPFIQTNNFSYYNNDDGSTTATPLGKGDEKKIGKVMEKLQKDIKMHSANKH